MQYINLKKEIEFENQIQDLLLISIDEDLETIDDKDGVRIEGKITIGGKVKTSHDDNTFSDFIDIDIFLNYEEIEERKSLNVKINDFNYKIDENKLILDISVCIEGLKEIITSFLAKEDDESIFEEEIEEKDDFIEEEAEFESNISGELEVGEVCNSERSEDTNIEEELAVEDKEYEEEILDNEILEYKEDDVQIQRKSLLKSVFSNKRIKEEISWKIHCVKNESSYEEIAKIYNVNISKLQSINKNEKLTEGKLIFIPLD